MKALVLENYGQLAVHDVDTPSPGDEDVIIAVAATGVCGSDLHGYTGENGRRHPGQIMGHEAAGIVHEVGARVASIRPDLHPGTPVTINPVVLPTSQRQLYAGREQHCPDKYVIGVRPDIPATFAQYVCVPAQNAIVLPSAMPVEHGALIEPMAVATHAVRRCSPRPSDGVLVIGGGPIGQSIVVALRHKGVKSIVVSEPSRSRRHLVESLGATGLDPTTGDVKAATLAALGGLADVVFDAVGITPTLRTACDASSLGARICLVGMGAPELDVDAYRFSVDERTLVGSFTYSDDDFAAAVHTIHDDPHRAAALITARIPLEDAAQVFAAMASATISNPGKTLIVMA